MDPWFKSILSGVVLVLVVGPSVAWVMRNAAKERRRATTSTRKFTVRFPVAVRMVFVVCALISEVVMSGVYAWQGFSQGVWDGQLAWLGHGLALIFLFIWAWLGTARIDVDGDTLVARTAMRRAKSTEFSRIDKADIDLQGKSATIYADGLKFANISLECTCMANLMKRFEQEGIAVSEGSSAPMTKMRLLWAAIRPLAVVFLGIAAATLFLLVFMCIFAGLDVRMLAIVPGLLGMIVCILAMISLLPARGLLILGLQERELGFDFSQEMLARGATGTSFEDRDYYVAVSSVRIVAFRRDYIKKITAAKKDSSGTKCTVSSKSGRNHAVYADGQTLGDLRRWFKTGAQEKGAADMVDDALKAIP